MTSQVEITTSPKAVEELYDEAYACVDQGICYDEIGLRDGALAMYERGLRLIEEAGGLPNATNSEMYQKMLRAKEHIQFRLKDLRSGATTSGVLSPSGAPAPPAYDSIKGALNALGNTKNAEELFSIIDGVQIFFIHGENTTAPSCPTALKIFKFNPSDAHAANVDSPPAFLQVGDWIYPLVPGHSPALHSSYGAYIFPNPSVDAPDSHVGVILPSDIDRTVVKELENLLNEFTVLKTQETPPELTTEEKEQLSTKIAGFLVTSGQYIAAGIKGHADKGMEVIGKQSESIRSKGLKTDKPIAIDPRVQSSVHYLRRGTNVAVEVSGYLVGKIGEITMNLGKAIASTAQKWIPKSSPGGSLVHGVMEVAGGGVAGLSTVWMSLDNAARVLAIGVANETVQIVDHKYGENAAAVADDLLRSAGYSATTCEYINTIVFKGIAKRTAKQAGLALLKDLNASKQPAPNGANSTPASDRQPPPPPS